FNLKNLDELPSLSEIRDLDELNAALNLGLEEETVGIDANEQDNDLEVDSENSEDGEADSELLPSHDEEVQSEEFIDGEDAFEDPEDASQELSPEPSQE